MPTTTLHTTIEYKDKTYKADWDRNSNAVYVDFSDILQLPKTGHRLRIQGKGEFIVLRSELHNFTTAKILVYPTYTVCRKVD